MFPRGHAGLTLCITDEAQGGIVRSASEKGGDGSEKAVAVRIGKAEDWIPNWMEFTLQSFRFMTQSVG